MIVTGGKTWFTATELAALALPGLSKAKRKVNERAAAERWALRLDDKGAPLARPRAGARGGAVEYHLSLLPPAARVELAKRGMTIEAADHAPASAIEQQSIWTWFESQSDKTKDEARRRVDVVGAVESHERLGLTRSAAVATVAATRGIGSSTLWSWLALVEGSDPNDRLPLLAPRRAGGGAEADIDASAWELLKSDYLRPEKPTWASCYWRMVKDYAEPNGLTVPHARTLFRKLEREVDHRLIVARREGAEALRRTLPAQQRTVAHLHALELVNIDGHKFDVFARFPDGRIGRPLMVAIQDIHSRKILAWRIGETESAVQTRLAFADLFKKWGIPKGCVLDNGRAFASKWITGGAKSRFRFKIREEEPTGLLTALGIGIHWAMPYRGQSKPIERAFRDLCDTIAKHPALAGAYTGNRPDAKPENYGDKAIDLDVFIKVAERGIAVHNARGGRRTEMAAGRSFDDVFAASYAVAPIGRATAEQLRMALLTADDVSTDRKTGAITIYGNRYWSAELSQLAGKRVTVRFDPDDLTQDIHVYDRSGRYLASAAMLEATGFLDVASARARAKQEAELRKTVKRAEELEQLLDAADLAAMLPDHIDEADMPTPVVTRPVRHRGQTAAALKPIHSAQPAEPQFIDRFAAAVGGLRLVE